MNAPTHEAVLISLDGDRFAFYCCKDDPQPFSIIWNASGSSVSEMVFDAPAAVFEKIAAHLTAGHSDSHTATIIDAARNQSSLANDVVAGVRVLREQLPYVTVSG